MQTKQFGTLIGSYGKGVTGSATVNFTTSGGRHCDDSCPLKGNGCYAITTEAMKPSITINLERKQEGISDYLEALVTPKALAKLKAAPWVRFAAFGSIPAPHELTLEDFGNLRTLGASLDHSRVHWPTETLAKADMLKVAGFTPRVSVATNVHHLPDVIKAGHVASCAVKGDKLARGKNKRSHSAQAITFMRDLKAQGINAKVCPAVAGNAKCGACTACADKAVQVIVYPMH
jgi:hypothetical protein